MNGRKLTTISTLLSGAAAAALLAGTFATGGAPAAYASGVAAIGGTAASGIQVQNLSSTAATVQVDLYSQAGGAPITLQKPTAANSSANFYLPSETTVGAGSYGVVLSSDQQIAAIASTTWTTGGRSGAATYGTVAPAQNVILPLVVGNYAGQNSTMSIQNAGSTAATVTIQVFGVGSATAVKNFTRTIQPGTSASVTAGTGDLAGLPNTQANPSGFLGYARISSNSASNPIVVQSFVDFTASNRAVYAFSGVDAASASTTLYAPLLRRNYFGTTGVSLVNPGSAPATVTINYFNDPASPSKVPAGAKETFTVPANSSVAPFQGSSAVLPAGTGFSNNGWFGSATMTSTQPIVAIVNDAVFNNSFSSINTSAAYNAATAADGAAKIYAPLVRNRQTSSLLTTGIQVQNVGTTAANVTVAYTNQSGQAVGTRSATIQPGASFNFYQGDGQFPSGNGSNTSGYGSAVITSTGGNVVAIVNDFSLANSLDAALYNALK